MGRHGVQAVGVGDEIQTETRSGCVGASKHPSGEGSVIFGWLGLSGSSGMRYVVHGM